MDIPASIEELHQVFKSQEFELYLVGGSVRDYLFSQPAQDFDLCTNAKSEDIKKFLPDKYKIITQGITFGVLGVYTDDQPQITEIATFPEDDYSEKGPNPTIKFSTIEKDVHRRDLTINGLYYDLDKKIIIDLVGARADVANKIARFIGDPEIKIQEDPIRILRIIRFAVKYQLTIEALSAAAIISHKESLHIIAKERIYNELKKSYSQGNFNDYLALVTKFQLWGIIFPRLSSPVKYKNRIYSFFENYLADLFSDEKDLDELQKMMILNYKIDTATTNKVIFLLRLNSFTSKNVLSFYQMKIKSNITDDVLEEYFRVRGIIDPQIQKFLKYKPSVTSTSLIKLGFKGKELGDEINRQEYLSFIQMI